MSILSLGQLIGGNQRSLYGLSDRLRNAVSEISQSADSSVSGGVQDSTTVSTQRLQARINTFREASQEVAKNISDVAFANQGAGDVQEQLAALAAELGAAADRPLDEKSLQKVNKTIHNIRAKIDTIAAQNQLTLPATQEQKKSEAEQQQALKLSSKTLLSDKAEVSNPSDIRQMLTVVQNAAGKVSTLQDELKSNLESFDMMASHLEVSMENQIAAGSYLPQDNTSVLDALLNYSGVATAAQGNRLQPNLMNLI